VPTLELVENGVDLGRFEPGLRAPDAGADRPVRFAFVGRLVDWKAVDLLLEALAEHARSHPSTLDVFGDGPERPLLERRTAELGLAARVRFQGFVRQAEVAQALRGLDALVLPSLYECGGAVVLEAMAIGLPVIATRWGGPADYLDDSCGVLVDPDGREAFVAGLTRALTELARDPARRGALGRAGRAKVERLYDWERKLDAVLEIYAQVAASESDASRVSGAACRASAPGPKEPAGPR
jgi:glycosyltransferase involved in cell wall biosynthesis